MTDMTVSIGLVVCLFGVTQETEVPSELRLQPGITHVASGSRAALVHTQTMCLNQIRLMARPALDLWAMMVLMAGHTTHRCEQALPRMTLPAGGFPMEVVSEIERTLARCIPYRQREGRADFPHTSVTGLVVTRRAFHPASRLMMAGGAVCRSPNQDRAVVRPGAVALAAGQRLVRLVPKRTGIIANSFQLPCARHRTRDSCKERNGECQDTRASAFHQKPMAPSVQAAVPLHGCPPCASRWHTAQASGLALCARPASNAGPCGLMRNAPV
jgi:hypothetical protein